MCLTLPYCRLSWPSTSLSYAASSPNAVAAAMTPTSYSSALLLSDATLSAWGKPSESVHLARSQNQVDEWSARTA